MIRALSKRLPSFTCVSLLLLSYCLTRVSWPPVSSDKYVMLTRGYLCSCSAGDEEQNIEIQLKTFGPQKEKGAVILIVNACSSRDVTDNVVGVCFVGQDVTGQKQVLDKFTRIQGDYKAIVQNPNPLIPPIFGTDEYGYCSEWNPSMEKLTGWKREEVLLPYFILSGPFAVLGGTYLIC